MSMTTRVGVALGAASLLLLGPWVGSASAEPTHRINQVQGAGTSSPLSGQTVTVRGVVVGIDDEVGANFTRTFTNERGVYIQSLPGDVDGDPGTSEGVFLSQVNTPSSYPQGQVVEATGQVVELFGLTTVRLNEASSGQPSTVGSATVPAPVDIDVARADSQSFVREYYETLEGMRVRLLDGIANSGGTNKFGEAFVVPNGVADRIIQPEATPPSLLAVDADGGAGNPPNPFKPPAQSTTYPRVDLFDRITNAVGPLGFSFGNFKLYVQPDLLPTYQEGPTPFPYQGPPVTAEQLRIAAWNVENFFPEGGFVDLSTVTAEEFETKRDRLTDGVGRLLQRPDVLGVQEVFDLATLQSLATALGGYRAFLLEGNDDRGIDNGFLVRDGIAVANVRQIGKAAPGATNCGDRDGLLYDRPPLAIDITTESGQAMTVITNHFASKSSPQSCREAQGRFLADEVARIEATGRDVVVNGDINDFETEGGPRELQTGTTLTNLWDRAPEQERYSFQFQARLQTLDHTFITDGLEDEYRGFRYAHLGTDYYDRNLRTDGHKASDHDAMVLTLVRAAVPAPVIPENPVAALLPLAGLATLIGWAALRAKRRPADGSTA